MKLICIAVALALALAGCTTPTIGDVDAAIQKTAPQACSAISIGHAAFVATGLGSDRDKQTVEDAFDATAGICADPAHATGVQLVVLGAKLAVITKALLNAKKAKSNG